MSDTISREKLDHDYGAVATIPDPDALLERICLASAQYRVGNPGIVDISYGPSREERLDIFLPRVAVKSAPVHIFIHGGYWFRFAQSDWSHMAAGLTEANAIVVVPNYALCPSVTLAEIVRQMRAVVIWLYRNIASFGGDPNRIFVSGHSAGGHLGAMLLSTAWADEFAVPDDVVKGAILISGLFDLAPIQRCFVQDFVHLSDHEVETLSPRRQTSAAAVPILIAVGGNETAGFLEQGPPYADALRALGRDPEYLVLPGHHHFSILDELSETGGRLCRAAAAQMGLPAGF